MDADGPPSNQRMQRLHNLKQRGKKKGRKSIMLTNLSSQKFSPKLQATTNEELPTASKTAVNSLVNPMMQHKTGQPSLAAGAAAGAPAGAHAGAAASKNRWHHIQNTTLSSAALKNLRDPGTSSDQAAVERIAENKIQTQMMRKRLTTSMKSGKLLTHQRQAIRQHFLIFALILTAFIVTILAGFGTRAATDAQLQTVELVGTSLLRSIRSDLKSVIYFAERELVQASISSPATIINATDMDPSGMLQMFKQLRTAGGGAATTNNKLDSSTSISRSDTIWGMYYANEHGLVSGVSRAVSPLSQKNGNKRAYYECWGKSGHFNQVRRTNASTLVCVPSQLDQRTNRNTGSESLPNIRQYAYEARKRPWYVLAKSLPYQIVWTQPYIYSSTGFVGVTVARWDGTGVFGVDITLSQFESFMNNLAFSTLKIGSFGSFPAELAILRNVTKEDEESGTRQTKKEIVVSSGLTASKMMTEYLHREEGLNEKSDMKSVELFDTQWFMFVDVMQFGDQDVMSGGSWNTIVVGMLRRGKSCSCAGDLFFCRCSLPNCLPNCLTLFFGHIRPHSLLIFFPILSPFCSLHCSSATFLGALELTSRTLYPFIAAALIIFFIPTIGIATRAILKVTKQDSAAKKAGDAAKQDDDTRRRKCNKLLRLGKEFHQALKLKYHIIFPIITAVLTSIVVHTAVTAPSSLITIHTFRALFGTISKCGLAYLLHQQWITVATDNMETRYNKSTTHRVVTGILAIWIVTCVVNSVLRASHELAPTMNKTTSVGEEDNDDDVTYFDAALVVQTVMECIMLLSLACKKF